MKKLIPFLVSGILVIGAVGCQEATKTGSETPSTTNQESQPPAKPAAETNPTIDKTVNVPAQPTIVPAPSTETKTTTDSLKTPATKAESDLKTEVSKKLNQDLPGNKLQVENKESEIILKGTASSIAELKKAEALAKEVPGVKTVKIEAKIEAVKKQ
ncbi:transporter [Nostoc linckia z18]|uniref:Transporter n=2 Tax=Nostoc linckia TaxID=92942 RepID=A0A9Q6EHI1_NOSLI|nr:BON domain-containing protein [Nostoc linckia]PHK26847.1 transporter [Nostoc linckia z15]PHK37206.1 transporter [Nostoc linckia z16]PHJ55597.1 transporter [Nostoc linckia z1]PHJ57796.1 transporter [Nostoc linckia z2]PHJ69621.1 transporter [Nostoc linckia z3]